MIEVEKITTSIISEINRPIMILKKYILTPEETKSKKNST